MLTHAASIVGDDYLKEVILYGFDRYFDFTHSVFIGKGVLKRVANQVGDNCCKGTGITFYFENLGCVDNEIVTGLVDIVSKT